MAPAFAAVLAAAAPGAAPSGLPADKLIVLIRSAGCEFGRFSPRLARTGRALARDSRTVRVTVDWPADPLRNLDMSGKPSPIAAVLEVSAPPGEIAAVSDKALRKLGRACAMASYLVAERRLMTVPRDWRLGQASPRPKVVTTLMRAPGVVRSTFVREWTGPHAEMSLAWRRARGGDGHYVQNIVEASLGDGSPELDGIGEIESAGPRAAGEAERAARMETAAHARTFQDMDAIEMFVAREVILKD